MSVRIFGHFEQFSTFSTRPALCSAHPCTPDAWTIGPYMTWVLCILVPMAHTRRGRSGATFVKVLAQSECGQFCHFGICGPNGDRHHAEWHGDFREPGAWKSLLDSWWIAHGMAKLISKQAWRYTIGSTSNFGSFRAAKMTPFWDPNFNPPCGQLTVPHVYAHKKPGTNFKLYTQIEVLGPASYPVSHWPCPGRASHP